MSYLDTEYDFLDKVDFEVPRDPCANCNRRDVTLFDYYTDDDQHLLMCDECCAEERRIEKLADQLAAAPSCDRRAMIIDLAETTRSLVNQLEAHDMTCKECAAAKKPVQSVRMLQIKEVA